MDPVTLGIMALSGATGGVGSWLSGKEADKNYRNAMNDYNSNMARALGAYQSGNQAEIDRYKLNSQQYMNTPEGVNAWLNPNMDYQLKQVANQNNQQYAAGGKMLSGAAMKSLQDRSQNVAKLSWQDAYNNMNAANNQGLGNLQHSTGMQTDMNSNLFNAQQGMYANQLSGQMNKPKTGIGTIFQGIGSGLRVGSQVANAINGK